MEFLRAKSREFDPAKQGINFILKSDVPIKAEITLCLRDTPLNEAVRYVAELSGLQVKFEDFAVVLSPLSACGEGAEMFTRVYQVPRKLMGAESDAKKWLAAQAVVFPEGSTAALDTAGSKLSVKNIPQELRKVEAILEKHQVRTKQPEPRKPAIVQRAATIIFPSIDFREATLSGAVEFLRVKSRYYDS